MIDGGDAKSELEFGYDLLEALLYMMVMLPNRFPLPTLQRGHLLRLRRPLEL